VIIGNKKKATSKDKFCCDYCGRYYSIRELHFSAEMDTKYENAVSTFGRILSLPLFA